MTTAAKPVEHRRSGSPSSARIAVWAPYILALFFALSALRGVATTDVIDTDAARHAMNGVFIYDMVRTHHIAHPIEYAKEYYGHLPALSMPYHPPVFPAIEAVFFAVLGVKLVTARLAVAIAVGLCAILLYRLVQATLANDVLAACATITTLSLGTDQLVARDVMLEFPAMVFTLAALYCLRDMDRTYPLGRALLFAALASAAVWTKQQTVFLVAMPFLYAVMSGRWRLLLEKPIWVSSLVLAAVVGGLLFLSLHFHGTGLDQVPTTLGSARRNYSSNVHTYGNWLVKNSLGLPGLFGVCCIALYSYAAYRKGRAPKLGLRLYFFWILSYLPLLMVEYGNPRYLYFLFPPLIIVGYALLFRGCACLWGERRAWYMPAGFAMAWLIAGLLFPPEFLRGPGEAATMIVNGDPMRVLYAGQADGNFIFAARALDPGLHTIVIPAQKLPAKTFEPDAFEQFCRQYGIDWVVLEDVPEIRAWSGLRNAPPAIMELRRSIPLESNRARWRGQINIYRFSAPAGHPGGVLDLPVRKIGGSIGVKL